MEFPKMLYCVVGKFANEEALKQGLISGTIETKIVNSADEESVAIAGGFSENLTDFIVSCAPVPEVIPEVIPEVVPVVEAKPLAVNLQQEEM